MTTIARSSWIIGTVLCLVLLAEAVAQEVSFPGIRSEAKSPDGRYLIRNLDDEKRQPAHALVLRTEDGLQTRFYEYRRHVDVIWSPASDAFVVNDYEGSDAAHPVLFSKPWHMQPVDLREELLKYLNSKGAAKIILDNHHVYLLARRWLSKDEILCRVRGYGDANPNGFSENYIYKVGNGFLETH